MNRPHPFKYLIGSWPVVGLAGLMAAAAGYNWYLDLDSGLWIPFAIFAAIFSGTLKSRSQVKDYRDWKRRWEGYAAPARKPVPKWLMIGLLIGVPLAFGAIILASEASETAHGRGILTLIGGAFVGLVVLATIWRIRASVGKNTNRRQQIARTKDPVVGICLKAPAADPTTLQKAYNSLPEHCYQLLRR